MSLALFLDEDVQANILVRRLRAAGHDVLTVNEAHLGGSSDAEVLRFASSKNRLLLTRNPPDFFALHRQAPQHPGIVAVYQHNDPRKNLSYADIVAALGNLENSGTNQVGRFIVLNQYHWRV